MSKPSGIWLRTFTGWWMTTINDAQHKLSKDEDEARKAFYKLMAGDVPKPAPVERHSVRWLCDKFLDRTKDDKTAETFRVQREHLKAFCAKFAKRPSDSLKAYEVNEWRTPPTRKRPPRHWPSPSSRRGSTGACPRITSRRAR